MNQSAPSSSDIMTIASALKTCTPEQQRRICISMLVLCGLFREAQQAIDIAVRDGATTETLRVAMRDAIELIDSGDESGGRGALSRALEDDEVRAGRKVCGE